MSKIKTEAADRLTRMTAAERADFKLWVESDGEQGRSAGEIQGFIEASVRETMAKLTRFVH